MGSIDFGFLKEALISVLEDRIGGLPQKAQDLIIDISSIFNQIAAVEAPYLTGSLRDSIQTFLGSLEATIESHLEYFAYVILGTEEHNIGSPVWIPQAVGWRYIGLSPTGGGKPHPGTKPNDFMQVTFDSGMDEVDNRINNLAEWIVE